MPTDLARFVSALVFVTKMTPLKLSIDYKSSFVFLIAVSG